MENSREFPGTQKTSREFIFTGIPGNATLTPTESALIMHRKPKQNEEKKINGFPLIMYLLGKMESMKDQLENNGKESSQKP